MEHTEFTAFAAYFEVLCKNKGIEIHSGIKETPARVCESMDFLLRGYSFSERHIKELIKTFDDDCPEGYDEIIFVKNIDFYSICEHHLLPFFGKIHVAYLPNKKLIGKSKLERLVEVYSRRLQMQERLVSQIAYAIMNFPNPKPLAAACIIASSRHLCTCARGVENENSEMGTSSMQGKFREHSIKMELLQLLNMRR